MTARSSSSAAETMHRARKSLGQNFLIDANIQRKIVQAAGAGPTNDVLEIGPGQGALTHLIAGNVRHLTAVELDRDLARQLRAQYQDRDDVSIVESDILDLPINEICDRPDRLIALGNIPYNITTPIIFHLLNRAWRPADILLMVQREVAERIVAPAGSSAYGALSVGVQSVAGTRRLFNVSRQSFRPVPNVDSAVVSIRPFHPPNLSETEELDLRTLTATAFSWRRKQMQKTLRSAPAYMLDESDITALQNSTGIQLDSRPETLAPRQFISLARILRSIGRPLPAVAP